MADVMMNYEGLHEAATKYSNAQTEIDDITANLDAAVQALSGNFQGEAYRAFEAAWQESKPTLLKLAEALGNFAPELNAAVERQREAEEISAGRLGSLGFK